MDHRSSHVFVGIRTRPDGCTAVRLCGEPPVFSDRKRYTFPHVERSCVERMPGLARFVGDVVAEAWRPVTVVVATLTPGVRLREASVDRGHLDGVVLLAAKGAGASAVISASTVQMKRAIPLMRVKVGAAMSAVCADLRLRAGRNGQITRDQFELEAIGAALFGAASLGIGLPEWAQQPGETNR